MSDFAVDQEKQCVKCGGTERFANNGRCVPCQRQYQREYERKRSNDPKRREYRRSVSARWLARINADPAKRQAKLAKDLEYRSDPEKRAKARRKAKAWRIANPEKAKDAHYRKTFGIKYEEFLSTLKSQGGKCAVCFVLLKSGRGSDSAYLDHDHSTDRVRGILCMECNTGLGKFADDPARLESAAAYLRRHGK